tara:strand:- start:485 stop:1528 length:1044 start_codon:yes stop_codon:yes gene_type:complete
MKVVVVGEFGIERFASHISQNISSFGHDVLEFEVRNGYKSSRSILISKVSNRVDSFFADSSLGKRFLLNSLKKNIKLFSPDLIFVTYDYLTPSQVDEVKKINNCPIILWYPDALIRFQKAHFMNANYDYLFFKDPYIVKSFQEILDSKVFYMPECFNEFSHIESMDFNPKDYACDISTAGNLHPYRIAFFKRLIDLNYSIKIWGYPAPSWLDATKIDKFFQNKPVLNSEKIAAFKGAKIVINNLHFSEIYGINVRAFEIAGSKSFQLIDYKKGLCDLFTDGTDIVSFKGIQDLKDKIKFYLDNEDLREKIAEAGFVTARSKHTYRHRINLIFETIFDNKEGFPSKLI